MNQEGSIFSPLHDKKKRRKKPKQMSRIEFCLNSILGESKSLEGICEWALVHVCTGGYVCVCMCAHTASQMSLSVCGAGLSLVAGWWQCSDWADFTEDVRGNLKAALGLRCLSPPHTHSHTQMWMHVHTLKCVCIYTYAQPTFTAQSKCTQAHGHTHETRETERRSLSFYRHFTQLYYQS